MGRVGQKLRDNRHQYLEAIGAEVRERIEVMGAGGGYICRDCCKTPLDIFRGGGIM